MRLVLLGPPGSGKGTQAELLSRRLNLVHLSTGDILREAIRQETPLGRQAMPFVNQGQLVPDSLVNDLINECFHRDDRSEHFVLDGYPRTLAQAASFDQVLRQQCLKLCAVVLLLVQDEEIVRRLSGRWCCPRCKRPYHVVMNPPRKPGICDVDGEPLMQRSDDREETVRERLRLYHATVGELTPYYRRQGLLREISGEGGIEEVYANISASVSRQAGSSC